MWQKGDNGETWLNWAGASAHCEDLELDGYTDWRLPEIEVLASIVNFMSCNPALSYIFEPWRSAEYWSSSPYVYDPGWYDPGYKWVVDFYNGNVYIRYKTRYGLYVRCVRGGPGSLVLLTLNKSGSGTGRVTSNPTRIDCGMSCPTQSANFAVLTQLTLTAQADPGSTFMGWGGGICSGTEPCKLTMGTASTVTVQFHRQAAIPTFSQWGMIIFSLLLIGSDFGVRRKRRA
jgi:hypothetical protein